MENVFSYKTSSVCSSKMIIRTDGYIIKSVEIVGGCPGNSVGYLSFVLVERLMML